MAHSSVRPSFLPSLVLLFLLTFPLFSLSIKTAKVAYICLKHRNPLFCRATLKALVGRPTEVDLTSVTQSVVQLAHTSAFDTITLFDLGEIQKTLTSGNYNGVNTGAGAVQKYAKVCDSNPAADPSPLPKDKDLEDLSIIVTTVSNFLAQI